MRSSISLSDTVTISPSAAKFALVSYANQQKSRLMLYSHVFVGALVLAKKMEMEECDTKLSDVAPLCRSSRVETKPCCNPVDKGYTPLKSYKKFCPPWEFSDRFEAHSFWVPGALTFPEQHVSAALLPIAAAGLSFVDAATEEVEIRLVTYNGQLGLFAVCKVMFQLSESGMIETDTTVDTVKERTFRDEYGHPLFWWFVILLAIQVFFYFWDLVQFEKKVSAKTVFTKAAIFDEGLVSLLIDTVNLSLYIAGIVIWSVHILVCLPVHARVCTPVRVCL